MLPPPRTTPSPASPPSASQDTSLAGRPVLAVLSLIAASIAVRSTVGSRGSVAAVPAAPAARELSFDGTFYQRFARGTNGTTATWQEIFARSVEAHPALQSQLWLPGNVAALHPIRGGIGEEAGVSWPENRRVVTSAGLPWCNMPKVSLT